MKKKILILEWDLNSRHYFRAATKLLPETEATITENPDEAIDFFRLIKPDLVIINTHYHAQLCPDFMAAFETMKKHKPQTIFIATSAEVINFKIEQAQALGFSGLLSKPFLVQEFHRLMKIYLEIT
jgi:DNA-binding NarL/FixJ family response regulator